MSFLSNTFIPSETFTLLYFSFLNFFSHYLLLFEKNSNIGNFLVGCLFHKIYYMSDSAKTGKSCSQMEQYRVNKADKTSHLLLWEISRYYVRFLQPSYQTVF